MNISNYLDAIAKPFQGLAPWILRLVLGTSFILHGYGKFPLPPERMVKMFESGGMPAPDVVASMVAIGEVGAGSAVILGGLLGAAGHLVTRCPAAPSNPPKITALPAATSPIATMLATTSGAGMPPLSNILTILSGGNGNLP